MQDAAGEVELRDEEGGIRSDFLHAVAAAIDEGDAAKVRELTLPLHEADLADLIQLLRPEQRGVLITMLGDDFKAAALPELDEAVRDQVLEVMPTEQVAEALQQLDSDEAVYLIEDLDKEEQSDILAKLPSFRARRARAQPRISGGFGRPHHADRSHRRAAVLVGGADDRLYERGRGPSRPLLRGLRGRSRLSSARLGRAQSSAALQADGQRSSPSPTATSTPFRRRPIRRRWRASSSATISPRRR